MSSRTSTQKVKTVPRSNRVLRSAAKKYSTVTSSLQDHGTATMSDELASTLVVRDSPPLEVCQKEPFFFTAKGLDNVENYVYFNENCANGEALFKSYKKDDKAIKLGNYVKHIIFLNFFNLKNAKYNTVPVIGYRSIIKGTDEDIAADALRHVFATGLKDKKEPVTIKLLRTALTAGKFSRKKAREGYLKPATMLKYLFQAEDITIADVQSSMKTTESLFMFILVDIYCRIKYIVENTFRTREVDSFDVKTLVFKPIFIKKIENDEPTNAKVQITEDTFKDYYRYYIDFNELLTSFEEDPRKNIFINLKFERIDILKKAVQVLREIYLISWGDQMPGEKEPMVTLENLKTIEGDGQYFLQFIIDSNTVKKLVSPLTENQQQTALVSPTKEPPKAMEMSISKLGFKTNIKLNTEGLKVQPKSILAKGIVSSTKNNIMRFFLNILGVSQEELQDILKKYIQEYTYRLRKENYYILSKSAFITKEEKKETEWFGLKSVRRTIYKKNELPESIPTDMINDKDIVSLFNCSNMPRYYSQGIKPNELVYANFSALAYEEKDPGERLTFTIDGEVRTFYNFNILETDLINHSSDRVTQEKPFLEKDFKDSRGIENIRFYYEIDASFLSRLSDYIKGTQKSTVSEQTYRLDALEKWLQSGKRPFFRLLICYRGTHFGLEDDRDLFGADAYILTGKTVYEPRFQIVNRITQNIGKIDGKLRKYLLKRLTDSDKKGGLGIKLTPTEEKTIKDNLLLVMYATGHSLGGTLALLSTYYSLKNPLPIEAGKNISRSIISYGFNTGGSPTLLEELCSLPEDSFRIYRNAGDIISFMYKYYEDKFKNKKNIITIPTSQSYEVSHYYILQNHSMTNFLGLNEYMKLFDLKGISDTDIETFNKELKLYGRGIDPEGRIQDTDIIQEIKFTPAIHEARANFVRRNTTRKNLPSSNQQPVITLLTARLPGIKEENESQINNNNNNTTNGGSRRRKTRKNRH